MRASWLTDAHRGGVRWARLRRHVPSICEDGEAKLTNRRSRSARLAILLPTVALLAAACGSGTPAVSLVPVAGFTPDPTLLAAAKQEGNLTTIALPHDWCDYGAMISGFKAKYGIAINELNPDGGSGDEINAIKANKGNTGPRPPTSSTSAFRSAPRATAALIQPYKVSTWATIPDSDKDADGYWYGDYYGVMSFEVNTTVVKDVPADWSDLLKPEYKSHGRPGR